MFHCVQLASVLLLKVDILCFYLYFYGTSCKCNSGFAAVKWLAVKIVLAMCCSVLSGTAIPVPLLMSVCVRHEDLQTLCVYVTVVYVRPRSVLSVLMLHKIFSSAFCGCSRTSTNAFWDHGGPAWHPVILAKFLKSSTSVNQTLSTRYNNKNNNNNNNNYP